MIIAKTKIGPQHHGRKMSLRAFEFAETEPGYVYELARGYIVVSEVANYLHAMQIVAIMRPLWRYDAAHPGAIHAILSGADCKLLVFDWDSERHPDISVYLTKPRGPRNRTVWRRWIPDLAVEVVSERSRDRDYVEKRDEYWSLGVKEYWIVDAKLQQVMALRRGRSRWTENTFGPDSALETKLLPGFKLPCRDVLAVVAESSNDES
ncbi:MAG: Uma2 family endonuclease [Gemmataceae bacterium]|nr:Uma2 family endonuclease [Gemmataceae bacterium]